MVLRWETNQKFLSMGSGFGGAVSVVGGSLRFEWSGAENGVRGEVAYRWLRRGLELP